MILLIDNYDSFTYNVYQLIESLGYACRVVRNDAIDIPGIRGLGPSGIVLSPGPGHPSEAGVTVEVIRELGDCIPIFGICLGHQAMGEAFGGKVVRAPRMVHGKYSEVRHSQTGVFASFHQPIRVARYHSLVIERESLPSELEITSETEDGLIMGVRHKTFPMEGVQFHPESVATPDGPEIMANFLRRTKS